jgi:hypothetical protein
MKGLGKILGINLGVLLIYSSFISFIFTETPYSDPYKVSLAFFMLLSLITHTITLIFLGVKSKKRDLNPKHKIYGITIGIIWLIGLSTCFGVAML